MPTVEPDHLSGSGHHGAPRRGDGVAEDEPARARNHASGQVSGGDEKAAPSRSRLGTRSETVLRWVWVLAFAATAAGLGVLQAVDGPTLARQSLATALGAVLTLGLAVRSAGNAALATGFALAVGVAAVLSQWEPLLGGAAVGTAVVAACLAVLATTPAPTFLAAVVEVLVALVVAAGGGLAAAGFGTDLDAERFSYTVLSLSTVSSLVLVHRLGGGVHGLGRRGVVLAAGALVLLVVVLVYTAALTEYGSPELVRQVRSAQDWTQDHFGGVPHPVEFLVGIPTLAWGVSLRSRRRQGWWACAFGAAATAHLASDFLRSGGTVQGSTLAAAYSLALGLLLAAVLIRLESWLTGRDGWRRTTSGAAPPPARHEPTRLRPLH